MKHHVLLSVGCIGLASVWLTSCAAPTSTSTATSPSSSKSKVPLVSAELSAPGTPGSVASGKYRNLFVELGHSEAEVKAKLDKGFASLFHGNPQSETVYYLIGHGQNENGPLAQVRDIGSNDVRSEGMSYGMMIAVQLNHQEEFNALWNWAKTYMYHGEPTHPTYRYFSWHASFDGQQLDPMPAPDGEEYFATALYFASGRWGNGKGIYDYHAQADDLLDAMKNRQDIKSSQKSGASLFNRERHQVRFTPDLSHFQSHGDHTDPSYHLPAFYELWSQWGPEADREFWKECAKTSRDFFLLAAHPETGLTPDYSTFDGKPLPASWDANTVNFRFDAWRTAMNWSVDWAWFRADPRQQELSDHLLSFFRAQGKGYPNQYTIDGKPTSGDHSSGLASMNAVATLASKTGEGDFVEALWNQPIPTGQWRYYDGMLYLMALLHVSGEFRVYPPQ